MDSNFHLRRLKRLPMGALELCFQVVMLTHFGHPRLLVLIVGALLPKASRPPPLVQSSPQLRSQVAAHAAVSAVVELATSST